MHKPIKLTSVSLCFPHKICFQDVNAEIIFAQRIGIIGKNGSGKSLLLEMLQLQHPSDGKVKIPQDVVFGYVPQIGEHDSLSGAQRFNKSLNQALAKSPNVLILDEPTNHLDQRNRKSLIRMLKFFPSTLIMVSHDEELLRECVDIIWDIENGKINFFTGKYDNFLVAKNSKRDCLERKQILLNQQKKAVHQSLMKEQERASKSKAKGKKSIEQKKWPTMVSNAKASRAAQTTGTKKLEISTKKDFINEELSSIYIHKELKPKFHLKAKHLSDSVIVSIGDGSIAYGNVDILEKINFSICAKEKVALVGDNASGKSTLVKAILGSNEVLKFGNFYGPSADEIGYLDQHYQNLSPTLSVIESLINIVPFWSIEDIRKHLNDFLFCKNEEVNAHVGRLSGGEKARLALALIAAKVPKLLILDEVTNNLDLDTKNHVIEILKDYPGTMLVISHDESFLNKINLNYRYEIRKKTVILIS